MAVNSAFQGLRAFERRRAVVLPDTFEVGPAIGRPRHDPLLPIKLNQGGVIPLIFAVAILQFPATVVHFTQNRIVQRLAEASTRAFSSSFPKASRTGVRITPRLSGACKPRSMGRYPNRPDAGKKGLGVALGVMVMEQEGQFQGPGEFGRAAEAPVLRVEILLETVRSLGDFRPAGLRALAGLHRQEFQPLLHLLGDGRERTPVLAVSLA